MKVDYNGKEYRFSSHWAAEMSKGAGEERIPKAAQKLRDHVRKARGERHDAIVYAAGCEFDPTCEDAVEFVSEKLQRSIGVTTYDYKFAEDEQAPGVVPAVTIREYEAYLANGGTANDNISRRIHLRAEREERCLKERRMTYVPDPVDLSKELDYFYMAQVHADIDIEKSDFDFWGVDFFSKYYGYFLGAIVTIFVLIECVLIGSK